LFRAKLPLEGSPKMAKATCVICGFDAASMPLGAPFFKVTCPRCGSYAVDHSDAPVLLANIKPGDQPIVSEWVYEQNRLDGVDRPPVIRSGDIPSIAARHKFTFAERVQRLLIYVLEQTDGQPGRDVDIHDYRVHAALQTFDDDYLGHIAHYLKGEGILEVKLPQPARAGARGALRVNLTPRGVMQAEELVLAHTASTQGFVAMWFHAEMAEAWEKGFSRAIEAAGYKSLRIDNKEHANKICDEIIAEIRKSRFVVADFTGHRGGVYFEAGYSLGRDIPVIWACRKADIDKLHFDIRQYNCIDWDTPEELSQRLRVRIEAVIGEGPWTRRGLSQ
jgi:nucleoside 2-deoxyribosyltransferase